jgi:membrane fusion protein (multidrug efflux system)
MAKKAEKGGAAEHSSEKNALQPGQDPPRSDGPSAESRQGSGRDRFRLKRVVLMSVCLAIGACLFFGLRWARNNMSHITIDDGRVKGNMVTVRSSVQGTIRSLLFQQGDRIEAGQVIAQLHNEELKAQVETASAAVRTIEAEIREADALLAADQQEMRKETRRETAALDAARARLDALQNRRRESESSNEDYILYEVNPFLDEEPGSYGSHDGDSVEGQLEKARAEVKAREARLRTLSDARRASKEMVAREQRMEVLKARLEEARATLASAELKLGAASVTSQISGILVGKSANTGETVLPGQAIAAVVSLDHLWIEACVEESGFERVRPGQVAEVTAEVYPGSVFTGTVVSVGAVVASDLPPASGIGARDDFTETAQRIPVRIEVSDSAHLLKPGMKVSTRIDLKSGKGDSTARFGRIKPSTTAPNEAVQ